MATAEETYCEPTESTADMDEANRIEAQRFIDVAVREINNANYENAIKLLKKAKDLHAAAQVEQLLELIYKTRLNASGTTNKAADSTLHQRKKPHKSSTTPTSDNGNANDSESASNTSNTINDYNKEQLELVLKIKKCKNFYQVLNVTRDASDTLIKKSYKKLALQLHPDKNKAPGAAEAFKTVANAVAVLLDERKRKDYDASGANTLSANFGGGSSNSQHASNYENYYHHHYHHQHANTFEATFGGDDISAEELFNMFFGSFPAQGRQRRAYQPANQRQPQEHNQQPSLVFGLILVLILISMISSFFTSDPLYSLMQSSKYPVHRETQHLSVPYYVKENFESDYQGSLGRLENSVEEDFIYTMKQNCFRERSYREAMMARARSFGNRGQFAQAQGLKMPSCDKLSKIGITRYSLY